MMLGIVLCMAAGISGCNAVPLHGGTWKMAMTYKPRYTPQPLDPWIPVTRVEIPRLLDRKPGWYKNRQNGAISYYDGCNWCYTDSRDRVMTCTDLYCQPNVTYVEEVAE